MNWGHFAMGFLACGLLMWFRVAWLAFRRVPK